MQVHAKTAPSITKSKPHRVRTAGGFCLDTPKDAAPAALQTTRPLSISSITGEQDLPPRQDSAPDFAEQASDLLSALDQLQRCLAENSTTETVSEHLRRLLDAMPEDGEEAVPEALAMIAQRAAVELTKINLGQLNGPQT